MLVKGQHRNRRLVRQERRGGSRLGGLRHAANRNAIDMHRLGDIPEASLSQILESVGQLAPDLVARRARNADSTGLGECFEACSDVDPVAKQIIALHNDVTDMQADAEAHLLFFGERFLHCDRASDGVYRAHKVGDDTIAGAAEDASAMARDVRISRCCSPLSPSALRAALIRVLKVESETVRPFHTAASRSSLLTMRSRLRIAYSRRSNTCGCRAISAPAHIQDRVGQRRSLPRFCALRGTGQKRRIILKPR
jgi:hypothetical protein